MKSALLVLCRNSLLIFIILALCSWGYYCGFVDARSSGTPWSRHGYAWLDRRYPQQKIPAGGLTLDCIPIAPTGRPLLDHTMKNNRWMGNEP